MYKPDYKPDDKWIPPILHKTTIRCSCGYDTGMKLEDMSMLYISPPGIICPICNKIIIATSSVMF